MITLSPVAGSTVRAGPSRTARRCASRISLRERMVHVRERPAGGTSRNPSRSIVHGPIRVATGAACSVDTRRSAWLRCEPPAVTGVTSCHDQGQRLPHDEGGTRCNTRSQRPAQAGVTLVAVALAASACRRRLRRKKDEGDRRHRRPTPRPHGNHRRRRRRRRRRRHGNHRSRRTRRADHHCSSDEAGARRHADRQRRGRSGQPVDAGSDAVRLATASSVPAPSTTRSSPSTPTSRSHPCSPRPSTPNADFTEWTFTLRAGITFHDGTPLDAAAASRTCRLAGTGLLIGAALKDFGKNPDGSAHDRGHRRPHVHHQHRQERRPRPAAAVAELAIYLAGQWGLIASPDVARRRGRRHRRPDAMPVGTGPFIVESYAPRDKLVVTKNPDYWQTDADGNQLPYLDEIEFRVIEDASTAGERAARAATSTSSRRRAARSSTTSASRPTSSRWSSRSELRRDELPPHRPRPRQARPARPAGPLRPVDGDRPPGAHRRHRRRHPQLGQRPVLARPAGLPRGQRLRSSRTSTPPKALIDEYEAETGASEVKVLLRPTVPARRRSTRRPSCCKGYWEQIGVTTEISRSSSRQFITNALFGDPGVLRSTAGATTPASSSTTSTSGGTPRPPARRRLALNFGRLRRSGHRRPARQARGETDAAALTAIAEEVNRQFGKECYLIPTSWTIWGTPHDPTVKGLGQTMLPDGSALPSATAPASPASSGPTPSGSRTELNSRGVSRSAHPTDVAYRHRSSSVVKGRTSVRYSLQRFVRFVIVFFMVTFLVMVFLRMGLERSRPHDVGRSGNRRADRRHHREVPARRATTWCSTSRG